MNLSVAYVYVYGIVHALDVIDWYVCSLFLYRLVGLVVKASASRAEDPGFESRFRWDFSGSSHTSDFKKKMGTPGGYPAKRLAL